MCDATRMTRLVLASRWTFPVLLVSGLIVRVAVLASDANEPLFDDAAAYYRLALQMQQENFDTYLPPGMSLFLLPWLHLPIPDPLACRLAMLPVYILFTLVLFIYVRGRAGITAANLAVSFFILYPAFVFHSQFPLTQLPAAALILTAVLLLERVVISRSWQASSAMGLTLGGLALIRPASLLLVPVFAGLAWWRSRDRGIRKAASVALFAFFPLLAWEFLIWHQNREIVFINSANSMNLFLGNNPHTPLYRTWWLGSHGRGERDVPEKFIEVLEYGRGLSAGEQDRFYTRQVMSHILDRPDLFVIRTVNRIRCFLAFDSFTGAMVLKHYRKPPWAAALTLIMDALCYCLIMLAALRYIVIFKTRAPGSGWIAGLALAAAAYAAPYFIAFAHPTYHFPVIPLAAVPAAMLAARFVEKGRAGLGSPGARRKAAWLGMTAVFILIQVEWVIVMSRSFIEHL